MLSFKGILKYSIYLFIAGWMFVLGIMVGRGSSPVTFDTISFQERLQIIAQEFGNTSEPEEKMDLQFYDALNKPALQEVKGKKNNQNEIVPKKESSYTLTRHQEGKEPENASIPLKKSRKAATLNKDALNKTLKKDGASQAGKKVVSGMYTIQIAAYKSFADAVTHMAILEKKGFSSYRTMGKKDGVNWYRVRIGSFATHEEAKQFIGKLKQTKINGMIIKKEN